MGTKAKQTKRYGLDKRTKHKKKYTSRKTPPEEDNHTKGLDISWVPPDIIRLSQTEQSTSRQSYVLIREFQSWVPPRKTPLLPRLSDVRSEDTYFWRLSLDKTKRKPET